MGRWPRSSPRATYREAKSWLLRTSALLLATSADMGACRAAGDGARGLQAGIDHACLMHEWDTDIAQGCNTVKIMREVLAYRSGRGIIAVPITPSARQAAEVTKTPRIALISKLNRWKTHARMQAHL